MLSGVVKSKEDTLAIAIINPFSKKTNINLFIITYFFLNLKLLKSKTLDLIVPLKSTITTEYLDAHVGMVDTRDLKSLGLIGRASSSLAVGTR